MFVAPLLYLHSVAAGSTLAAGLTVIGCCGYVATKISADTTVTTISAPFSILRYVALAWLIVDMVHASSG